MTLVFKKHNGPTPTDDIAPQIITDCGNLTLDFKQLGLWASPPFLQTLGPWFPNEIQNLLSSEKRTLDHWTTVQFFFSLAQVRRLLTPASVHSLWSSPKFLNWFCLTILISLRFSRLVVVVHESLVCPEQFNCLLFFRKILQLPRILWFYNKLTIIITIVSVCVCT